jgi:hypothetical protein
MSLFERALNASARAQLRQVELADQRHLGVWLAVAEGELCRQVERRNRVGLTLRDTERVPVATVTDATVTDEPVRFGGALLVGPVGLVRQRGDAYLTISTTGPVWSVPVPHKHRERARQFAAELLSAAHAAGV